MEKIRLIRLNNPDLDFTELGEKSPNWNSLEWLNTD